MIKALELDKKKAIGEARDNQKIIENFVGIQERIE
jgi:hypothetical protein